MINGGGDGAGGGAGAGAGAGGGSPTSPTSHQPSPTPPPAFPNFSPLWLQLNELEKKTPHPSVAILAQVITIGSVKNTSFEFFFPNTPWPGGIMSEAYSSIGWAPSFTHQTRRTLSV